MKDKYIRLKAILLAGTIALSSSSLMGCNKKYDEPKTTVAPKQTEQAKQVMSFGIGEHVISVPIEEDIRTGNFQHKYHPGYEPIGISLTAYGSFGNVFGGGTIVYSNIEEVECSSTLIDNDGNYLYLDFGTPINYVEKNCEKDSTVEEFDVGEHIISIPIQEDNRFDNFQYTYHEGYEVVGISETAYGNFGNVFGKGVLLYQNTIPVRCTRENNNQYTSFGTAFENKKTKVLQ